MKGVNNFYYILACEKTSSAAVIDQACDLKVIIGRLKKHSGSAVYSLHLHSSRKKLDAADPWKNTKLTVAKHETGVPYYVKRMDLVLCETIVI